LIENWVLKSYMHNEKTAKKFWVTSTSHWRKETYKHKVLVRMWNTYMLPWNDKKEDLIKNIKYWVYVSRMWGWQVNTTTWDFVFKVQNGFLIENWELTKNVVWATLSWNWPEMLNEIYWICDDLNFFDGWTCWKWQSMPVSDGVPTFWTKLKVSA
jgi:TldD protein